MIIVYVSADNGSAMAVHLPALSRTLSVKKDTAKVMRVENVTDPPGECYRLKTASSH